MATYRLKGKCGMVFSLFCLCLAVLAAQVSSHYEYFPAGNFPGAVETVPLGVSTSHIVGDYQLPGAGTHAYIQTGQSFLAAGPSGSTSSYLSTINRFGVAAGGYCTTAGGCNPQAGEHGYIYNFRTGKIRIIDFPQAGTATTAYGINDSGVIVGGYCPGSVVCPQGAFSPASHGFVDTNGVFTTLDFPGAQGTSSWAINNAGTIVGFYLINNTGPHAFIYQNGTFSTIDFPGSGYTIATAINNFGVVAGLFSGATAVHGFIYYNGQFAQIDVPGAVATGLTGINARNDLVGTWNPPIGLKNFLATPVTAVTQP